MAKVFDKFLDFIGLESEIDEGAVQAEAVGGGYTVQNAYVEEPKPAFSSKRKENKKQENSKVVSMVKNQPTNNLVIFRPSSCEDASTMIDSLKARKAIVANFETVDRAQAQRILDILSGAMYSLSGTVHKVSTHIYIFAPENVDVTGESKGATNNQRINSFFSDSSK